MAPNVELLRQKHDLNFYRAPTGFIDAKDIGTPDAHVSRDPNITRLTGKHPLNAETPIPLLMDHGFITPNSLHIVRNHGPVPQNQWDTHRITISGLVNKPITITMDDILHLPSHTLPVTICCAGSRRKEQNMIKPSIGFSWGPGGIGTAYYTGVFLRDLINDIAGGLKPEALHICMEGNDNTAKGGYGTSITVNRAMSPEFDVLIAYKMNGEPLPYDHGYPVRCIVPGCIGGRSVKWLSKIEASTSVSQNPFQNADNKVFPSTVLSADQATEENWWTNPDYSVYDLNVNGVIAAPYHGSKIALDDLNKKVVITGFAYGGSNRKVTRCEITLDDGKTWNLAEITDKKPEGDRYASEHYGYDNSKYPESYNQTRYWTWVHWSIEVSVADLLGVQEFCLRCWNETNSVMPKDLNWSLMGMLNNCWYRVKLHLIREPTLSLIFQHPTTLPGDTTQLEITLPGWMEESQAEAATVAASNETSSSTDTLKTFTLQEVEKHTAEGDCWLIYDDLVYNCTPFLKAHPGGASSILLAAGTDCTEEFDAIHSQKAKDMLADYLIGKLGVEKQAPPLPTPPSEMEQFETAKLTAPLSNAVKPYFDPRQWKKLVLQRKECMSATIRRFTFAIPQDTSPDYILSLPTGLHLFIKLPEDLNDRSAKPKMVMRAYTPSKVDTRTIEFVIKIYYPFNSIPGGKLTTSLDQIRLGETVDFKGPVGEIQYLGDGEFDIHNKLYHGIEQIGMIAGGTGITPMWQLIQSAFHDSTKRPFMSLIYCARSIDEIIFYEELKQLECDQLRVRLVLSEVPDDRSWTGGVGRFTMEELKQHLFPFADSTSRLTFLCGPDSMLTHCCLPLLKEAYGEDFCTNNVFAF
ncbi:histone H2B [Mucor velutinosus]|uniref:Nitrate reductase [NADPH] n=1 Tax=Mucor velutinosus TaxID=708070 RepID=A0AAN7DHB4_9FUNG|nr:histone H2B [Mucor velutinosus]